MSTYWIVLLGTFGAMLLVLLEIQHDLRKLAMLRLTSSELHRGPTIASVPPPPPDQSRDRDGAEQ